MDSSKQIKFQFSSSLALIKKEEYEEGQKKEVKNWKEKQKLIINSQNNSFSDFKVIFFDSKRFRFLSFFSFPSILISITRINIYFHKISLRKFHFKLFDDEKISVVIW